MIFPRRVWSGLCICGHRDDDHHGNMIMNPVAYYENSEGRSPGECEFYGWNECTDNHCAYYHDALSPHPDPVAHMRPRPDPSVKVGGCA